MEKDAPEPDFGDNMELDEKINETEGQDAELIDIRMAALLQAAEELLT